jgi:probable F420-dependent oxidoreductase
VAASRPFRFAVQSFSAGSAKEWRDRARQVEELGYSALHLADHFLGPGEAIAATGHPIQQLAAVPAMAVAAEATRTLRVGCRVFCIDYRHPVVLAKGAGWLRAEYEAAAIPFDPPPVRIARLAEVIGALKALMTGEAVDIDGEHVKLHGFAGAPLPVQRPHPPIMIGGGGRRVLELAAREANVVSFNFNNRAGVLGPDGIRSATAEETARKVDWVRAAAGDRFADLELEIGAYFTIVTDDPKGPTAGMAGAFGISEQDMAVHPHALIGSVDAICDELVRRRETYGISYVTVGDNATEAFAPVVARLAGS